MNRIVAIAVAASVGMTLALPALADGLSYGQGRLENWLYYIEPDDSGGDEHGRARAFVFASWHYADDKGRMGSEATVFDDFVGEQPEQVLLDDHRRRVQRGQADGVHGESCEGCSTCSSSWTT